MWMEHSLVDCALFDNIFDAISFGERQIVLYAASNTHKTSINIHVCNTHRHPHPIHSNFEPKQVKMQIVTMTMTPWTGTLAFSLCVHLTLRTETTITTIIILWTEKWTINSVVAFRTEWMMSANKMECFGVDTCQRHFHFILTAEPKQNALSLQLFLFFSVVDFCIDAAIGDAETDADAGLLYSRNGWRPTTNTAIFDVMWCDDAEKLSSDWRHQRMCVAWICLQQQDEYRKIWTIFKVTPKRVESRMCWTCVAHVTRCSVFTHQSETEFFVVSFLWRNGRWR